MKVRNFTILIALALLLCSCANPYSSLYGDSPSKIKEDVHFLELYKNTICGIKEKHEYKEISSGKCLALYYDYKEQNHTKNEWEDVVKRIRYILEDPGKIDPKTFDLLSKASIEIADCKNYITENCLY